MTVRISNVGSKNAIRFVFDEIKSLEGVLGVAFDRRGATIEVEDEDAEALVSSAEAYGLDCDNEDAEDKPKYKVSAKMEKYRPRMPKRQLHFRP